jgi:hypothetical protein
MKAQGREPIIKKKYAKRIQTNRAEAGYRVEGIRLGV